MVQSKNIKRSDDGFSKGCNLLDGFSHDEDFGTVHDRIAAYTNYCVYRSSAVNGGRCTYGWNERACAGWMEPNCPLKIEAELRNEE